MTYQKWIDEVTAFLIAIELYNITDDYKVQSKIRNYYEIKVIKRLITKINN